MTKFSFFVNTKAKQNYTFSQKKVFLGREIFGFCKKKKNVSWKKNCKMITRLRANFAQNACPYKEHFILIYHVH